MPNAPPHPCNQAGCGALTNARFCARHKRARDTAYERRRGSAAKRGYGRRWRRVSKAFLAANPYCRSCGSTGRVALATEVDHVVPVTGPNDPRFFDESNWQSLCGPCHSTKTAREDGGGWGGRSTP